MVIAAGSTPTSLASAALTLPMLPDAGTFTRHIRLDVRTRTVMVAIVVDGHSKLHWEPSSWVPAAREWHAREATPGSSGRVAVEELCHKHKHQEVACVPSARMMIHELWVQLFAC